MKLNKEDGKSLISIAKESISSEFGNKEIGISDHIKERYSEKSGVFVTLTIDGELRGCIGFTEPMFPLWEAVANAARAAAFEDPRFPPLTEEEWKSKGFNAEVSVLTEPEELKGKPESYPKQIEIGKHGLIVEKGHSKGLLLPQVFTEYRADAEKALEIQDDPAFYDTLGWIYYLKGMYREAHSKLARAIEVDPHNSTYQEHIYKIKQALVNEKMKHKGR